MMSKPDQDIHEKISALLDDELGTSDQQEVLHAIGGDDRLAGTWQRYHLIRAAVRREAIVHLPDLSERVASALQPLASPAPVSSTPPAVAMRWVPGIALAASIVGLASLGVFALLPGGEPGDARAPVNMAVLDQGTKWDKATSPDLEHSLNVLLVEHGEFAPMPNMNGLMAYAKFVSYDSGR